MEAESFYLGKLSLPVHISVIRSLMAYAREIGRLLNMDEKGCYGLENSVEEAFSNAVSHFSGPIQKSDRIHVEFMILDRDLVISIREKGIPFDIGKKEVFMPGDMEKMDNPGLGSMMMAHAMDKVEYFIHGRKGKETRLTRHLEYFPGELTWGEAMAGSTKKTLNSEAFIRRTRPHELNQVMQLAWKCYGYTQEAFLYDLEAFARKIEDGELISIVAVDSDREALIGHIALKYHDPCVKVPEMGLAFVDPDYRNSGIALLLGQHARDLAKKEGNPGFFDCSVTTHPYSQQGMQSIGSRPCGMFLGVAAAGLQARQLDVTRQEKGSVVNHYQAFDRSRRTVYAPGRHREMISQLYKWLDLPRIFEAGKSTRGESRVSLFFMPEEHNAAFITVHAIGRDCAIQVKEALGQCRKKSMDAVYSFLPMESPGLPALVDELEITGMFFAGIMPHIHNGGDRLMMQYINIYIEPSAIKVYGEMTPKLVDYILNEKELIG